MEESTGCFLWERAESLRSLTGKKGRTLSQRLIVGMKYTEYNLLNLLRFLKVAGKRIAIFAGSDAMTLTNLEFGGSGGVIGVANVAPKLSSSVFDEFRQGNVEAARLAQWKL